MNTLGSLWKVELQTAEMELRGLKAAVKAQAETITGIEEILHSYRCFGPAREALELITELRLRWMKWEFCLVNEIGGDSANEWKFLVKSKHYPPFSEMFRKTKTPDSPT